METTVFGSTKDLFFMKEAFKQAEKAFEANEVPIGAVVVDECGTIISYGYNQVEQLCTQAAHAEMRALSEASKIKKDWRLNACWLYVTLEPCIMCMGMIYLTRLSGVVYGADSPLFGSKLDKVSYSSVYKSDLLVVRGLYKQEIIDLLRCFFKKQRSQGENVYE
jgi:tRNA(adenine34) deaminase